jgi:hypothetical protein
MPGNRADDVQQVTAVLRSWEDRFGARLLASGTTGSSCWPNARPVTCTPPSASPLKFALGANEFSAWNDDAVTSVSEITSSLLSSPIWSLWWD